ncbi:Putative beta-glucosidase [Elusimicrobium minutum Pei191]|uniref:beta-N-acetylhexosaminidase n=1 Tax=Elusimicrobium minutum (strain Pei191) TaxID=445932 RepID=B2KAV5_ELUMP|nr:glycoside hydrolase family 3 protein [Elusimicrobium minutum]ACC97651.1 Putative beta-glucosidase [Elusimicrobium minutum Pei191]
MKKLFFVVFFTAVFAHGAVPDFDSLTLDQKLGQTLVAFVDTDNAHKYQSAIEKGLVGGVLVQWGNYSLEQTTELAAKLQSWAAKSPHKIPLLISIDYEGGTVYTPVTLGFEYLPPNMMIAAANDEEAAARIFYLAGLELRKAGIHINFSPVVDVNINPGNPIIGVRSFGSSPELVGRMGAAVVSGLSAANVMSVAKHFPGHGNTVLDSHYSLPVLNITKKEMQDVHLAPFKKAIEAGVPGIMTAHIIYKNYDPKNPATYSKRILNDLLRTEMKFKGVIISDALDMKGATLDGNIALSAAKTLEAGSDMALLGRFLNADKTFNKIYGYVGTELSQKRIEEASKKILDLKKQMGLFDEQKEPFTSTSKAYAAAAEVIAKKSVTVLRNKNNKIPLKEEFANTPGKKVCAVFFAPTRFAEEITSFNKPFLEKGWKVNYYNAIMKPTSKDLKRARECAKGADLFVIGTLQWAAKPFYKQTAVIGTLLEEFPDAVVISTMSPYEVKTYPGAKTVLLTYGISKHSMKAAADVIVGNIPAQGKLPIELE